MTIKDRLKLTIDTLSRPYVGVLIGIWGIFTGYYSITQGIPEGVVSVIVGASVMVIAFADAARISIEKKIDDLKDSLNIKKDYDAKGYLKDKVQSK